jgi:Na+/glutamate symporter
LHPEAGTARYGAGPAVTPCVHGAAVAAGTEVDVGYAHFGLCFGGVVGFGVGLRCKSLVWFLGSSLLECV